jgi:WXXGXW repeat (2 copies)
MRACSCWLVVGAALVGCGDRDRDVVVEERPTTVVVENDTRPREVIVVNPSERRDDRRSERTVVAREPRRVHSRDGREIIIVDRSPPPVRVERRIASPGREYIWVPGYWKPRGREFEWVAGRYERVRQGHRHTCVEWSQTRDGWEFRGEHWRREER